jgi:F-type H+-transporting ATPase subunit delta
MRTSRALAKQIVSTYGEALYDAVAASNAVDEVSQQLEAVLRLVRSSSPLRDALADDSSTPQHRGRIAQEVFAGLNPGLLGMLAVMAERQHFDLLVSVADRFAELAEERRGAVAVDVVTAVELTAELRQAIATKIAADLNQGIVLREKVDPSIIGGVIISAHGRRIDASISSQLESARGVLSTASTGGEA